MKIVVTNRQLRFYKEYGWTKDAVSKLLISKYIKINELANYYFADDVTQRAIFVPSILNHNIQGSSDVNWYIRR